MDLKNHTERLYSSLNALLLSQTYDVSLVTPKSLLEEDLNDDFPTLETQDQLFPEKNIILDNLAKTFDQVSSGYMDTTQLSFLESFISMVDALKESKRSASKSRTSKLWVQYMDTVDILCSFIKAERTGNWSLHLSAIFFFFFGQQNIF